MSAPARPTNFYAQSGNGAVQLNWDLSSGATTYPVLRSADGVTFSQIAAPAVNYYTDSTGTVGTLYYYKVEATSSGGTSAATSAIKAVPTRAGTMSLLEIRQRAQERADRVNSNFVSTAEWNSYINQSIQELYDLLVTEYEDYYVQTPYTFTTDGTNYLFALPNDFYKLLGVDCGLDTSGNARVNVGKFDFIARNRYVYPNVTSTYMGVFNMQYRLMGSNLHFIPTPGAGQVMTVWYIPRIASLLNDNAILDGISGWAEYIICDSAIKALQKEEQDVTVLMAQKQALIDRIQASAMNRDAGSPDTISSTRSWNDRNGGGGGWGDGSYGGF